MGGVDVHDQLRLQRYSLQLARRYKKYYMTLFLGLIDLAIINAYIVFNCRRARDRIHKMSHVELLKQLHLELCQLQPNDWQQLLRHGGSHQTPTKTRQALSSHVPLQMDEWRKAGVNQARKRRQQACKVCSVLKKDGEARGGETTFYCGQCMLKPAAKHAQAARVFLCNKVKHSVNGVPASCFEIWHKHWKNGRVFPLSRTKRKLRVRKSAQPTGEAQNSDGDASDASSSGSRSDGHRKRARGSDDAN